MHRLINAFVVVTTVALLHLSAVAAPAETDAARPPNVIVIVARDLGFGDLSCFGQKKFKTPALDAMAAEGMRFTQFYSGGADGASSRRVLLTGLHGGHAITRGDARQPTTLPADIPTMASILRAAGYSTARVGDWEPGAPEQVTDDASRFIREKRNGPFFLLIAVNVKPPENRVDQSDAAGDAADQKDWPQAERAFVAGVGQLDREVRRLLDSVKEMKIERQTLVLFTSECGPRAEVGHDPEYFDSNGKYRGAKGSLNEGGIRVPTIAWWPGTVPPASENDRQWYVGDLLATAAELAGVSRPDRIDSDSFASALRAQINPDQWARKSRLYWESNPKEGNSSEAVRFGKWKALRTPIGRGPIELYDMSNDPAEKRDYSQRRPDLTRHATNLLNASRSPEPSAIGGKSR